MQSSDLFKSHRFIWTYYGLMFPKRHRNLYLIYSIAFTIAVTITFPLHLIIGLCTIQTKSDIFENLAITFANIAASYKLFVLWHHLNDIKRIDELLTILDKRVKSLDEKLYQQQLFNRCKRILQIILSTYVWAVVIPEIAIFYDNKRKLKYPAWFPMEIEVSAINYWIAHVYQFIAVSCQCTNDYSSDTYASTCLALLSGHVRLLAMRVSKLGKQEGVSQKDNNKELKLCIKDHQNLIELYHYIQKVLSKGMFLQICLTSIILCSSVISLMFYVNSILAQLHYVLFFISMALEIFPVCYYGSMFELEFLDLSYAIFSCNWMDQDKEFKTNVIMFSRRCLKPTPIYCMGMFRIHLDTFFAVMKSAYSLFAVVLQTN